MSYPEPTTDQLEFFREHGWLVVDDAIPKADLDEIEARCQVIMDEKERLAFDWAWDAKEAKEDRSFRIVQSSPTLVWPDIAEQPYRIWLTRFAGKLLGFDVELFFDQFLAKPPGKSAPTYWHQDEGYWGRNLDDKGITCWIPLRDATPENGCMQFVDHGHKDGVLTHRLVEGVASDLLTCDVDESRRVVCPIPRGSVTFHHSKTPHMTNANTSGEWRKVITNHLSAVGVGGEGDHYPWKVYVNQRTGERTIPPRR